MAAAHRPAWSPEVAARVTAVRAQASVFETKLAEFESANDADLAEVIAARRPLGHVPLMILTQDRAHFRMLKPWFAGDVDAAYAQWLSGHDDEARDSTRGENRVVDGAGHDIEDDRPDAVLAAFRAIVDAARTQ